jgi:hypothetical protein
MYRVLWSNAFAFLAFPKAGPIGPAAKRAAMDGGVSVKSGKDAKMLRAKMWVIVSPSGQRQWALVSEKP